MGILPISELDLRSYHEVMHADVAALRSKLRHLCAWPEAGDLLLEMLPHTFRDVQPVSEEDNQWLTLAAGDAVKGCDIGAKYPAFFHKLLTHALLRTRFLSEISRRM